MANFFKYGIKDGDSKSASPDKPGGPRVSDRSFLTLLFTVFILVTLLFFPRSEGFKFSELKEGDISNVEIIAPFTFLVEKDAQELERERSAAVAKVLAVFHRADSVENAAVDSLVDIQKRLVPILLSTISDSAKTARIKSLLTQKKIILGQENLPFFTRLTRTQNQQGVNYVNVKKLAAYFGHLKRILVDIFAYGILNIKKQEIPGSKSSISVLERGKERVHALSKAYEMDRDQGAKKRLLERLRNEFGASSDSVGVGYALLENLVQPNLIYDVDRTAKRIEEAISSVPLVKYRILEGERIIDSHERVEARHVEILRSLADEIVKREAKASIFSIFLIWIGKLLMIILTLLPFLVFLFYQRRRIWDDRRLMFMIFSTILFVVILSGIITHYHIPKYLIPIAVVPIIVTSYQDTRTGFFAGASLSLLIGAQIGIDYEITLIGMLTTAAAIFALGFSKYRRKLANASILLFIAYFVGIAVLGIIRYEAFHAVAVSWGAAVISSILSPMIAYSFIIFFDAVFDVASEFKLIELSDLNNPLLKMFSIRSPGSYHHSLQVSNLSEAAAEAIGANALLTKVGAYYHDIGKMFMPEYFVENQRGGKNPHDRLTPRLSSLILINHVRKGYEYARENKIPTVVCEFITEHHGSSLMQFFYEKAKEKAHNEDILETDFRYPGAKPQSKETGILMLADSVEATVRSLKETTPGKIQNTIRNVVENKIRSGELDDCPLTMKDLAMIIETFSTVVAGIHHGRLEYPGQKELVKRSAFEMANAREKK